MDPGGHECDQDDSHRYGGYRGPILSRQASLTALPVPAATSPALQSFRRELGGKRLELLKEAVPKLARVALLYDPANPPSVHDVKEVLPVAARALRLTLQPWKVRAADDFDRVFASVSKQRPDGLYVLGGTLTVANQKRIAGFALKSRLPSMRQQRSCRCRWAHILRGGPRGQLSACRVLRGQNPEGRQARRSAGGAADQV